MRGKSILSEKHCLPSGVLSAGHEQMGSRELGLGSDRAAGLFVENDLVCPGKSPNPRNASRVSPLSSHEAAAMEFVVDMIRRGKGRKPPTMGITARRSDVAGGPRRLTRNFFASPGRYRGR
jgi:hypothetical protein